MRLSKFQTNIIMQKYCEKTLALVICLNCSVSYSECHGCAIINRESL